MLNERESYVPNDFEWSNMFSLNNQKQKKKKEFTNHNLNLLFSYRVKNCKKNIYFI